MDKLVENFIDSLSAGNLWVGFLLLGVFYLLKKEPFKIFTHFSERKHKDIEQAKSLLECGKLSKESNELIREHIEKYAFRKYYGINANKEFRMHLLNLYQKHQPNIGWHDFRRASPYYHYDGKKLVFSISWKDKLYSLAVVAMSWLIGGLSLLFIVLAVLTTSSKSVHFIVFTFFASLLFGLAILFRSINWPYESAIKLRKIL